LLLKKIEEWKTNGETIGFVPTMGALHEGHLSLVRLARENADKVVVSIFVNPAQFAPDEDFDLYPRDLSGDAELLAQSGADIIYAPKVETIYPDGPEIRARSGPQSEGLESDFRPHFFDGVVTVVSTLFDHVQPDIAVFGEKDFQQLQVVREMCEAQKRDIQIFAGPIIRDEGGLALSSRNQYLSRDELTIARQLNKILKKAARTGDLETARTELLDAGFDKIDYVDTRWDRVLAAAWIGKTRLIDNVPFF